MTETTGILLNFTEEQMQLRELVRDVVKKKSFQLEHTTMSTTNIQEKF